MKSFCPNCGKARESSDSFCKHCGAAGPDLTTVHTDPTARGGELDASDTVEDKLREALAPGYQLIKKLGEGGMGSVFLARDPTLKRMIAVKVLSTALATDPDSRKRFEREAQSVAAVSHPNIVSIFSIGELDDDTPYFLMEYVTGKSLEERIQDDGPLPMDEAKLIIGQVGAALAAAHRAGIIHRDIKPANVLQDEETGRVLVSDFGISAVLPREDTADSTKLTQVGMAIGTPAYMSPEQIAAGVVTERTDVYSLGILAYEILTGSGPYDISTPQEAIAAHLRDEPRKLSTLRDDIDVETQTLVEACLDKDPENRPDAKEIERRLMRGSGGLLEWPPPGLDRMMGMLRTAGWLLMLASGFVAVPVSFGVSMFGASPLVAPIIAVLAALGVVVFFVLVFLAVQAMRNIAFEVRRGFGWLTLLEVAADSDGRTGDLIAGTREFASVAPPKRSVLRLLRVFGAVLILLSSFLPVATLSFLFWLGSRDLIGHDGIHVWVVGPTIFLLLVVLLQSSYEKSVVGDSRRRLESRPKQIDPEGKLVRSWSDTFEVARKGQRLPSGATVNRTTVWAIGALLVSFTITVVVAIAMVVSSNLVWVAFGGVAVDGIPGRGVNAVAYARFGNRFRTPVDTTVTDAMASQALYSLLASYGDLQEFESLPDFEIQPVWWAEWQQLLNDEPRSIAGLTGLITAAFDHTLTQDQTELYSLMRGDSVLALFSTVARAQGLDNMWSAQFGSPISQDVLDLPWDLFPHLRYLRLRLLWRLKILEAVGYIAEGRVAGGEASLREVVSVGLLLLGQDNDGIGNLMGRLATRYGLSALGVFYQNSGQLVLADSIAEGLVELTTRTTTSAKTNRSSLDWRRVLVEAAVDSTITRSSRWWAISEMSILPCLNLREFVFGPDEDIRESMIVARNQLVRSETEAQMFDKLTNPREKLPQSITESFRSPFRWVWGKHTSSCLVF